MSECHPERVHGLSYIVASRRPSPHGQSMGDRQRCLVNRNWQKPKCLSIACITTAQQNSLPSLSKCLTSFPCQRWESAFTLQEFSNGTLSPQTTYHYGTRMINVTTDAAQIINATEADIQETMNTKYRWEIRDPKNLSKSVHAEAQSRISSLSFATLYAPIMGNSYFLIQ